MGIKYRGGTDRGRPNECSWETYAYDLEAELNSADDEIDDLKAQIKDLERRLSAEEEPKR